MKKAPLLLSTLLLSFSLNPAESAEPKEDPLASLTKLERKFMKHFLSLCNITALSSSRDVLRRVVTDSEGLTLEGNLHKLARVKVEVKSKRAAYICFNPNKADHEKRHDNRLAGTEGCSIERYNRRTGGIENDRFTKGRRRKFTKGAGFVYIYCKDSHEYPQPVRKPR